MSDALIFNPMDDGFRRNSAALYQRFLKEDPVHNAPDGSWLICRYKDVQWILTDRETFQRPHEWSKSRKPPGPLARFGENNMISMNPPDHTRFRKAMARAFAPKMIKAMEDSVRVTTARIIGNMSQHTAADFIDVFALPLPVAVICDLMKVPEEDHSRFGVHTRNLIAALELSATPQEQAAGADSTQALYDYLAEIVDARANDLGTDLISLMLGHEAEGSLTRDEVVWAAITLLIAGHETTTHLIGNGLVALLNNPDQYNLLVQDRSLAGNAVEEFLRYDPSLYVVFRQTKTDVELMGKKIPAGDRLVLSLAAANRDPEVFTDPQTLEVRRDNAREHLTFAGGIHLCLGHALARLEGRIAFECLFDTFRDFEFTGDPVPRSGLMFKGYESIPVAWKDKRN